MYRKYHLLFLYGLLFICMMFSICGCAEKATPKTSVNSQTSEKKRSNTPIVRVPEAPQTSTLGTTPLFIDTSHTAQGYVMAKYIGTSTKANIQITGPDHINYKYFLTPSDSFVPLPLTGGNGTYQIDGYENIIDNKYTSLFKETIDVSLEDEFLPYLYPNQYVNFSKDTKAVAAASDIVKDAISDLDAVADIYHYVIEHITYDDAKAESVTSGYLPDVDSTLESGTGICFDYAALTTAMLRSQNIPTRLEIGYSGDIYHSWISVYIEEVGWIDKIIEFSGDSWTRMDPTFAAGNNNSEKILKYIGDGENYTVQYKR